MMLASWVRSATLYVCRGIGVLADNLRKPLLFHLMMITGIAAALASVDQWRRVWLGAADAWLSVQAVLVIWSIGAVVAAVFHARRRLVIARFEDFSEGKSGLDAAGFGVLVASHLSSLTDLFRTFESGRTIQSTFDQQFTPLNASFETEGAAPDLRGAISSDATFALGFFKIPVGFVWGLLTRVVQGPRLSGQLHRDGRNRIITVRLAGRLGDHSWRIVDSPTRSGKKDEWRSSVDLAGEIACRVFAEAVVGKVDWAALAHHSRGVRSYRQALFQPRDREVNLREAERHLIEATAADPHFDLPYYNLGVVYTELKRSDQSEKLNATASAFENALRENRERWSTHYALASANYERAQLLSDPDAGAARSLYFSKALDHCGQARAFAPDSAAVADVLHVTALVLWRQARMGGTAEMILRDARLAGRRAKQGVWSAWRTLCAAEIGFGTARADLAAARERARTRAARNLTTIAEMSLEASNDLRAPANAMQRWMKRSLLREAARSLRRAYLLTPLSPFLAVELGSTYILSGKWEKAVEVLRAASRLNSESADTWALLTFALVKADRHHSAAATAERIFECSDSATDITTSVLVQAGNAYTQFMNEIDAMAARIQNARFRILVLPAAIRLAWRHGERQFISVGAAMNTLALLIKDPDNRKARLEEYEQLVARAKNLRALHESNLTLGREEKIDELKKVREEARANQHAWEFADAAFALATAWKTSGDLAGAEECVRDAIAWLEKRLPREIKRRGFHALLSLILRSQIRTKDAFAEASTAIAIDPLSAFERIEMGWVYYESGDFVAAELAWREALLMTPNDAALHVQLGQIQLLRITETQNAQERSEKLAVARQHIENALLLLDRFDPRRNNATFILAVVHASGARYDDAIRELRTLEKIAAGSEIVRLHLAECYLSNSQWAEAGDRLRRLSTDLDDLLKKHGADHQLAGPPGWEETLGVAAARAHLGIANALGSREIKIADALAEVAAARGIVAQLTDKSLQDELNGKCDFYDGWLQVKLDQVDQGIPLLESALAADTSAEVYLALAEGHARRIEIRGKPVDRQGVRRARFYWNEAQRLDWTHELDTRLPRIDARLSILETT
jgi:tetratricopeptide (TPR) repeat protein